MATLLWLYFTVKLITFLSVSPHFIPSTVQGIATRPLVVLVRAQIECRAIGISINGPKSQTSIEVTPEDGSTLRVEYPRLIRGHYEVYVGCLDVEERILQLVDAGSVDVV